MSAQFLRDGAAAARRVAAMHKGGQQQPIHQAVADWLDDEAAWLEDEAERASVPSDPAMCVATAYLGREQP